MTKEWSSPDVSFRMGTNGFGETGFTWCKVQGEAVQGGVLIFSIKNGKCVLAVRALAVCAAVPFAVPHPRSLGWLLHTRQVRSIWSMELLSLVLFSGKTGKGSWNMRSTTHFSELPQLWH